ncbi:MAG: hypothetical protein L6R39_000633 [Caloplaca ligustica]|nr:MAG: hypothetical protein L6R39_000633 [Caloplaca ligustica]
MSPLGGSPKEVLAVAESQWIFTENELLRTPSILDGLTPEKEHENRSKGVNFIFQVGIMLRLPQVTLATASVLLHRFYVRHSMVDKPDRPGFHYYSMAATCIFLATKIEEDCRKMRELVIACVRVAQKDPHKLVDEQDKEYWRWKDNILHSEDVLLEALCFDLTLEPPYNILSEYLTRFGESHNRPLRNSAWAFINDSCMTILCLMFSSRQVAASALYAAAKHSRTNIPDDDQGRPWWDAVAVDLKTIKRACNFLASVYENAHVKNGRDVSIHERTPEDGDESTAKTRARAAEEHVINGSDGVEESRKRTRSPSEAHEQTVTNGHNADGDDDFASNGDEKRRLTANGHVSTNGDGSRLNVPDVPASSQGAGDTVENISEEGEVES